MGLFNLFGGKKKDKAKGGKPAKPAAKSGGAADVVALPSAGAVQVKLRLKLVASLRAGEHGAAYEAAKNLADIQAKAGRRTGARVWREQAERIKASDPAIAA